MVKRLSLVLCVGCVVLSEPGAALAQESEEAAVREEEGCFPACRTGYLCHPVRLECVSLCNPPCSSDERCTDSGECIADVQTPMGAPAEDSKELGDLRFRLVIAGRFGLGGNLKLKLDDPFGGGQTTLEGNPDATLGVDIRAEKPVLKHLTVGGIVSNFWFGAADGREPGLDIAVLIKPRVPLRAGGKEAEFYVQFQVGPSFFFLRGDQILDTFVGFNIGFAPGFQIFVAPKLGLLFEVGYMYDWGKHRDGDIILSLSQAVIRFGFTVPF